MTTATLQVRLWQPNRRQKAAWLFILRKERWHQVSCVSEHPINVNLHEFVTHSRGWHLRSAAGPGTCKRSECINSPAISAETGAVFAGCQVPAVRLGCPSGSPAWPHAWSQPVTSSSSGWPWLCPTKSWKTTLEPGDCGANQSALGAKALLFVWDTLELQEKT